MNKFKKMKMKSKKMMSYDESKKIQKEIDELINEVNEMAKGEENTIAYYAAIEALEMAKRLCELNRAPF